MKKSFLIFMLCLMTMSTFAGDKIKTNYRTALVMAYSPVNSFFEDENIRLEIYNEQLWAINKTDRAIFIDLSQCFLMHNGSSYPIYDEHQDDKSASRTNISTSIDGFISIAPSIGSKQNDTKICNLASNHIYGEYTTTESPSEEFSEYEKRFFTIINELVDESLSADPKGKNYLGTATRHLTEDESVSTIGASIAYAFNKRSDNWTPVTISTWVSDIYLSPYYVEMPVEINKKKQRGFGVKKTEAAKIHIKAESPFEFDQDKSPIIVCDWTGNLKKGTFNLSPTWVLKSKKPSVGKQILVSVAGLATGGLASFFLADLDKTRYKSEISFDGVSSNWGKMFYMKVFDLSQFNNIR